MRPRASVILAISLGAALAASIALAGCATKSEPAIVGRTEPTAETSAAVFEGVTFDPMADGLEQPLFATGAGDGSGRLFVLEKTGRIRVVKDGALGAQPFLDLSAKVSTESEQGLLGLAFSPSFARDGLFYVDYTDASGATVVSRFLADGETADPASEQVLLRVEQPFANHNGGMIAFGPDGYLYVALGDGGSGGDPHGNGQDRSTLLGSLLRLDVGPDADGTDGTGYSIPADNPFVGVGGVRPEIWAYGLRNPWRFSFDRLTGDLWIGDVGQNAWEEIDFQPASSPGGENYGWNVYEATHPYPAGSATPPDAAAYTMPLIEYDRDAGTSVTGGYVYRGTAIPGFADTYVYGDFVSGRIWSVSRAEDGTLENSLLAQTGYAISSFGEDDAGELYVVDFGGAVYRIVGK
jgi:glucose/arabinose dehydrogenase